MPTKIFKGQSITLSTTEVDYELGGDVNWPLTTVTFILVSGSAQCTAAAANAAPRLDATYATYSTAGDKWLLDIQPGRSTIRMRTASAGVVIPNW